MAQKKKKTVINRTLWGLVRVLTLPFWLIRNRVSDDGNMVRVVENDNSIMLWPVPLLGSLLWFQMAQGVVGDIFSGWTLAVVVLIGFLAFTQNIDVYNLIVLLLVLGVLVLGAHVIHRDLDVPILGPLLEWVKSFEPPVGKGFWSLSAHAALLSIVLYALPIAFLRGRVDLTSRTADRISFGRREFMQNLQGLSPAKEYKDVLEFLLLFGGGSLVFLDRDGRVVFQVRNVIGLAFIFPFIEPLYQATSTRQDENEVTGDIPLVQ